MINLILAILSSALISIIMRFGEGKIKNNMGMFFANYVVCAIFSCIFMNPASWQISGNGFGTVIWLGVLSGVLYLTNFVLMQLNMNKNGVVLTTTFMKIGVVIPTLMAILVFKEAPRAIQIIGILLALIAIVVVNFEKDETGARKGFSGTRLLLPLVFLCSGFTESMANIYDKVGSNGWKDQYLLFTFGAAGVYALILCLTERKKVSLTDVLFGVGIGIPNYFSARFLLGALHQLPAVIVYPVYSVATIVVICTASVLIFREKLGPRKLVAIGIIIASLVLLNL